MLNFKIREKYFSILAKKISDVFATITGIPPLSLPNSKGENLKSYSISGNVDESIIGYSESDVVLPDGYRRLEYIESSGTQYIKTDYTYGGTSDVIEIDLVPLVNGDYAFFGSYGGGGTCELGEIGSTIGYGFRGNLGAITNASLFSLGSRYKITFQNGYWRMPNGDIFGSQSVNPTTTTAYLFGRHRTDLESDIKHCVCRIYSLHIVRNSSIIVNFIPCINPNNEIGMYDTVSNKFYGNAGTGTFIASPFNLLRTAGRTEQAVTGSGTSVKRILQGDKWAKLTANNNIATPTNVVIGEGSTSFSASANGYGIGFPVKLKPNHSYTVYSDVTTSDTAVKMDLRISFYTADGTWLSWQYSNSAISGKVLKSFIVPSNADMTVILCAKSTGTSANTPTLTFSDIMLVEGVYTTANAPAYTPFKQLLTDYSGVGDYDSVTNKYKIPVLSSGKNLFDISAYTFTEYKFIKYTDGTYNTASRAMYASSDYIRINPNTTYTLSGVDTIGVQTAGYAIYDSSKAYITGGGNNSSDAQTFTTGATAAYLRFTSWSLSAIQLEIGSERTDYEPYIQPTQNNIFVNNSLFKTGESVDAVNYPQNKTVKAVGKYVFTGTETIELYDNSKGFRFAVSNMATGNCIDGYCNRFENFKNVTDNDVPRIFFGYDNNYVYFRRFSETATTTEAIKAILANWYSSGKPLTIWYLLEDETEEAVTLPDIPTIQGSATIMIDTEVQPSEMSVEYAVEGV